MPETQLVTKLLATSAVTTLIGDRLRMIHRKTSWGSNAAITYQRISLEKVNHAGGTTTTGFARIQLDLWASTPAAIAALASAVSTALNGWYTSSGSPTITMCHLLNEMDGPEGPDAGEELTEYRRVQEYQLDFNS